MSGLTEFFKNESDPTKKSTTTSNQDALPQEPVNESKDVAIISSSIPSNITQPDKLIIVSNPRKKSTTLSSYLTYTILTQETASKKVLVEVERKETDFEWLHSALSEEFMERIIPPLPPKIKMLQGKHKVIRVRISVFFLIDQDDKFLQTRRRFLQRFIQVIVNHPELRRSEVFRNFVAAKPEVKKLKPKILN